MTRTTHGCGDSLELGVSELIRAIVALRTVDGRPARDLVCRGGAAMPPHIHMRFILDGERLYLLDAMTYDGRFADEQATGARYFLESFHFSAAQRR